MAACRLNKMLRNITITPVLNGFVVNVGCQGLAYTNIDKLIDDLSSYLRDPETTAKRILKEDGFNRKHTLGDGNMAPPSASCDSSRSGMAAMGIAGADLGRK